MNRNCKYLHLSQSRCCWHLNRQQLWMYSLPLLLHMWRCGVTGSVNNGINEKALTSLQLSRTLPAIPPPITYAEAVVANTSTAVVDSSASNIYFAKDAAICNFDSSTPKVNVGTATGQVQRSTWTAELNLPSLPANFPTKGHIMPSFKNTLLGIGKICDADCKVVVTKEAVVVYNAQQQPIISGWRETSGPNTSQTD